MSIVWVGIVWVWICWGGRLVGVWVDDTKLDDGWRVDGTAVG